MNKHIAMSSVAVTALLCGFTAEAVAQTIGLEEIVVTARKREESLMRVPITVTAITAESMATRDINDLAKVVEFTPSFYISNAGGTVSSRSLSILTMRGITGGNSNGAAKGVSMFIDGSPAGSGIFDSLDNIERVEVLKGPQATYFGRATFAGAVNLVTKTPGNEFKGTIEALLGNNAHYEVKGSLMGPIVEDKLGFSLSARVYSFGGDYKNYATLGTGGGQYDKLGAQSTKSLGASLNATPSDRLSIKVSGNYWSDSDGPAALVQYRARDYNCNAGAGVGGALNYLCGTLPQFDLTHVASVTPVDALFTNVVLNDSLKFQDQTFKGNSPYIDHGGLELRGWHAGTQINYEIPAIGATATLLGGANSIHASNIYDFSMLPLNVAGANPNFGVRANTEPFNNWLFLFQRRVEDKSAEFRLTSEQTQRFRWVTGASYVYVLNQQSTAGIIPTGPANFTNGSPSKTKTKGIFLGLSYDIVPDLTLDLEGREQWDHILAYKRPRPAVDVLNTEATYKNFVPRVNLSYRITPDTMIYGLWSKGLNPGQFNISLLSAAPFQIAALAAQAGGASLVVKPEKLSNFELGVKSGFWDGRARVAASVYYARWTDQVVSNNLFVPKANPDGTPTNDGIVTTFAVLQNIGLTTVQGVEMEGVAALTDHLTVDFAAAYNGSTIKSYKCLSCVPTTGSTNVVGNQLPIQPAWTANAGAEYKSALTSDLDWFARTDVIFKSGMYDSFANTVKTPVTWRVNFRLGVSNVRYKVEAFMTNAFDNRSPTSPENNVDVLSPGLSGRAVNAILPQRRQFGVRGSYNF